MTKASGGEPDNIDLGRVDASKAVRTIIVTYHPPDWDVQIEKPDWVSPHEASAMLDVARIKPDNQIPEWAQDDE